MGIKNKETKIQKFRNSEIQKFSEFFYQKKKLKLGNYLTYTYKMYQYKIDELYPNKFFIFSDVTSPTFPIDM